MGDAVEPDRQRLRDVARFLLLAYKAYRGDPRAAILVIKSVKASAEKARELA